MTKACLEPDEVAQLEAVTVYLRDRILIKCIFHQSLSITEAIALEPKDVDFNVGTISIKHLKPHISLNCPQCNARLRKSHGFCPKCGEKVAKVVTRERKPSRVRTIPMDQETSKALKDYFERGGPVMKDGKKLVFGISRHRAYQIIKGCAKRAAVSKLISTATERRKSHRVMNKPNRRR